MTVQTTEKTISQGAVADVRKANDPLPTYVPDVEPAQVTARRTVGNYLRFGVTDTIYDLSEHVESLTSVVLMLLDSHETNPVTADELVGDIDHFLRAECGLDFGAGRHARTLAAALAPLFRPTKRA